MTNEMIFQLGTNNWQRQGEFAPGSGILHEAHHKAFNSMNGVSSYSMYPSRIQKSETDDVRVFELAHDIPICESVSPVSSYRWHSMSETEFDAYRIRLTSEVETWMDEIEVQTGRVFTLAIAHHTFLNPVVMRDVIANRVAAGRPPMRLVCFAHGTALKMYANERAGLDEYPERFGKFVESEGVFDPNDSRGHVDVCAAISTDQVEAFLEAFPFFRRERVLLSPNGYNESVFKPSSVDGNERNAYFNALEMLDGRRLKAMWEKWWCSAASSPIGSASMLCCWRPPSMRNLIRPSALWLWGRAPPPRRTVC